MENYQSYNRQKYKREYAITCGLWDAYKDFKKEYKHVHDISRKQYVDLCHEINKRISEKIIKESFEFRMPAKLGTLSIKKNKLKIKIKDGKLQKNKMIVDWKKTWDYWLKEYPGKTRKEIYDIKGKTVIYNMNEHTNGYVMTWVWDKSTCVVPNKTVYYFKPVKYNRLNLATWINSEERENDYFLERKVYGSKGIRSYRKKNELNIKE